jgi:O-antigen ligase
MASSPPGVKAWRLAAWLLSLVVFGAQIAIERRRRLGRVSVAVSVALGVAIGAFVLAALGPFRSHWGDPSRLKLALLSLAAWPVLTGVLAFLVALIAGFILDRFATDDHPTRSALPNEQ